MVVRMYEKEAIGNSTTRTPEERTEGQTLEGVLVLSRPATTMHSTSTSRAHWKSIEDEAFGIIFLQCVPTRPQVSCTHPLLSFYYNLIDDGRSGLSS